MKKLTVFFIFIYNLAFAQVTTNGNASGNSTDFLGWNSTVVFPLRIEHKATYSPSTFDPSIEFWISGAKYVWMDGNTKNMAVGNSISVNPPFKLTVENDIDLENSGALPRLNGFRINGEIVLATPGATQRNTFLGVGAGANLTSTENTLIGNNAGKNLTYGNYNTFLGIDVGLGSSSGAYNTFLGQKSGLYNNSSKSTFIGYLSGAGSNVGDYSTMIGCYAGQSANGSKNTSVGYSAGSAIDGSDNVCIGNLAGPSAVSVANKNVLIGSNVGWISQGPFEENTVVGFSALTYARGANKNTLVGTFTGEYLESGDENTFIGHSSGRKNQSGTNNTFVGKNSGIENLTGNENTYIGANSGQIAAGLHDFTNSTTLGANAIVRHSNHMILGDSVNVGIGLSNDPIGPQNKLELCVNQSRAITGQSGLRFTNLNSTFLPGSTASKFLTVDGSGDVILKDIPSGIGTGNVLACTTPGPVTGQLPLWSSTTPSFELCNSIVTENMNQIGISNINPLQKLDVDGNINLSQANQSYFIGNDRFLGSGGNGFKWSIELGHGAGPLPGANIGFSNIMIGTQTGINLSSDESYNILIGEQAGRDINGSYVANQGNRNVLLGTKAGSNITIGDGNTFLGHNAGGGNSGILTYSNNSFLGNISGSYPSDRGNSNLLLGYDTHLDSKYIINESAAIGPHSWVGSDNTLVMGQEGSTVLMGYNSIPTTIAGCKLYVTGNGDDVAYFNGNVYTNATFIPSDRQLKNNIQPLDGLTALAYISHLNPSSYRYDLQNHPGLTLPQGQQYGLIADELEIILPNLVHEFVSPAKYDSTRNISSPSETFKAINYTGLIPLLIKVAQDQTHKSDSLENVIQGMKDEQNTIEQRLSDLEQRLNRCCNISGSQSRTSNIDLSDAIILTQNAPNPFAEQTKIEYYIPENYHQAKIVFYNASGIILKTFPVSISGKGELIVYAENLSSGIYTYSLIVDDKVIDTKKMVCSK